ncbi:MULTISPECIES: DUF1868 domain-containing protein, partial [unclassified Neorhizobium]|uniref:DUF1868 domain-containing protein n=1 Tax=unclassified Neorhizobium TaxID=2629175 RepID=UPI001FF2E7BF
MFPLADNPGVHGALTNMVAELKTAGLDKFFAFLPADTLHITAFEGLTDIPQDELNAATARFGHALEKKSAAEEYRVSPVGLTMGESLRIVVEGANDSEKRLLWDLRNVLHKATKTNCNDLTAYEFHISLAYPKKKFDNEVAQDIAPKLQAAYDRHIAPFALMQLGRVGFYKFEDMGRFTRIGTLGYDGYTELGTEAPEVEDASA